MELSSEKAVTKILSEHSILDSKKKSFFSPVNPKYDLSGFLDDIKRTPSPYGEKYIFVK